MFAGDQDSSIPVSASHFGTGAELSAHFGTGAELSGVWTLWHQSDGAEMS